MSKTTFPPFFSDSTGQYLLSGNHDGCVTVYDTQQSPVQTRPDTDFVLNSCQKFQTHNDTVNGIRLDTTTTLSNFDVNVIKRKCIYLNQDCIVWLFDYLT